MAQDVSRDMGEGAPSAAGLSHRRLRGVWSGHPQHGRLAIWPVAAVLIRPADRSRLCRRLPAQRAHDLSSDDDGSRHHPVGWGDVGALRAQIP